MPYDNYRDVAFLDYFMGLAPLDEQERENERRRAIIEEMRGEATAPLQGRRAGRVYLAPSPFEGLAKLGQAYMARKGGQKAYAEEQRLADERVAELGKLQKVLSNLNRSPQLDEEEEEELYNPYFTGSSRSV
jgi:hypothetical protein